MVRSLDRVDRLFLHKVQLTLDKSSKSCNHYIYIWWQSGLGLGLEKSAAYGVM